MKNLAVTAEQRSLLNSKSHSLRPLSSAGFLHLLQVFHFILLPLAIFLFAVLCLTCTPRFYNESFVLTLRTVALGLLLLTPAAAFVVLVFGVVVTKWHSRVRWPAVFYWMWWPSWKFVLCLAAAAVGCKFGNSLWFTYLMPYQQMMRLQAYNNVNPSTVSGIRLQDAGVAIFNSSAGVDRARGGCLMDSTTYCVAPIILGTDLTTSTGGHDMFMTGTDCCDCPGEFRCGDWNTPALYLGGMRVVSAEDAGFYKLAVQSWSATYGKTANYPIFFKWVADPVTGWHNYRSQGMRLLLMCVFGSPFVLLFVVFALNFIFKCLVDSGICGPGGPSDAPMLPPGQGRAMSEKLLPGMHKHYNEQRAQSGYGV